MTTTNRVSAHVIHYLPQIDGVRILAIHPDDARAVRRDPAMIDAIRCIGAIDVSDGRIQRAPTGPRWGDVPPSVQQALEDAAR